MADDWRRPIAARPRAWVLGSAHPSADRSIAWGDPFPNFSDPDVLIVDLTTLTVPVLERMDGQKLAEARQSIRDKYYSRGIVVVITQPSFSVTKESGTCTNYSMLPIELQTKKVPKGRAIMWGNHEIFRAYRPHVEHFSFYIESYDSCLIRPPFAMLENFRFFVPPGLEIQDRSQHYLGAMLTVSELDDAELRLSVNEMGQLVLLPPPTGLVHDAIGSILSVYGKAPLREEVPPAWVEKVAIQKGMQLKAKITNLREQGDQIWARMDALARERDGVLGHRRLLYSKGGDLEAAVANAFRLLGIEAEQAGGADKEDCVLAMDAGGYAHGVVEVKGADGRTRQQDIVQCGKWVDVWYAREGKLPKGVFVPNQHRKEEYSESRQERLWFEPNELEYAKMKNICIIPSCALFEAAKKALDGEAPDRAEIVARIAGTKGVLERVF